MASTSNTSGPYGKTVVPAVPVPVKFHLKTGVNPGPFHVTFESPIQMIMPGIGTKYTVTGNPNPLYNGTFNSIFVSPTTITLEYDVVDPGTFGEGVTTILVCPNPLSNVRLVAGRSNPELAQLISTRLNIPLTKVKITYFGNGEICVKFEENIRGRDIYIIQTGGGYEGRSINDHLIETCAICDACTRSSVKSKNLVMPCYAYARADKKDKPRVSVMGSCVAGIYDHLGISRIISMDLHSGQIQGFFRNQPLDNIYCMKLHIDTLENVIFKGLTKEQIVQQFVLACPDMGAYSMIKDYAQRMKLGHCGMAKQRDYSQVSIVEKTILIGEPGIVQGKTVILVDDIFDTCGTVESAAKELKEHGAKDLIIVGTHGVFSGPAFDRINSTQMLKQVFVSNSLPQTENLKKTSKLTIVDISNIMATTIRRLNTDESVSELFV